MFSHLLYYSDLFHEQSAALSVKTCSFASDTEVLAWGSAGYAINNREFSTVKFCDISVVFHLHFSIC